MKYLKRLRNKNIEVFLCLIFLFDGDKYMKKSDNKKEKRIKKIEYSRLYYEKNKYDICKKRVNQYLENSIRNVESFWKNKYSKKIEEIEKKVPYNYEKWDKFSSIIVYEAYRYSIHRMTLRKPKTIKHINFYIRKMIKLFIVCTLIIFNEKNQICKTHGLKLVVEIGEEYNKEK